MWQGQQPPGGEQHSQDGYVNPYQQHQQPNPYATGTPSEPPRGGRSTTAVAVAAATAVVIAAGVTGYLVLGGDKDDTADPGPTRSASSPASKPTGSGDDDARDAADPKPVIPGWKVVVNPKGGIAFDVPPEWGLKSPSWSSYVSDNNDPEDKPLIGFSAPAMFKEKWCQSDDDKNGTPEDTALGTAGSRGEKGARTTEEAARNSVSLWLYGAYTQPDKKKIKTGAVEPYTARSGIKGSVATAVSTGVDKKGKCDTDGKATTFAFEDSKGDFVSWTFLGAKGVAGEVPDATVRKILSTVRLVGG
ncbi:hypothetical protein AB0D12_05035 [Streptomyces sp. NPDC048479]|uniref:hypothetical protein n=1 Tax=Streptomyces sp. NPDC048479 TaxID=3154725 RepID=UPI0034241A40